MSRAMQQIMVGVPSYDGTVVMEFCRSFAMASLMCAQKGIYLDLVPDMGSSLIQVSRNWLFSTFLRSPQYSHLLFIDADVGFEPDAILKLLAADKDLVAGVYPGKVDFPHPVMSYLPAGPPQGFLQPAKRVPTGFMLMKRRVAEVVAAKCEKYSFLRYNEGRDDVPNAFEVKIAAHEELPGRQILTGEDYLFCDKVTAAGFEIWVRTDLYFVHVGRRSWEGKLSELLEAHARAQAMKSEQP